VLYSGEQQNCGQWTERVWSRSVLRYNPKMCVKWLRKSIKRWRLLSLEPKRELWASWIQSKTSHTIFLRSTLIFSSHLHLGVERIHFLSDIPTKILYAFLISPMHAGCPAYFISVYLITIIIFVRHSNYKNLHCVTFSSVLLLHLIVKSKYSSQHPFLKHPQSVFFP
jgi:hypothetical protein